MKSSPQEYASPRFCSIATVAAILPQMRNPVLLFAVKLNVIGKPGQPKRMPENVLLGLIIGFLQVEKSTHIPACIGMCPLHPSQIRLFDVLERVGGLRPSAAIHAGRKLSVSARIESWKATIAICLSNTPFRTRS